MSGLDISCGSGADLDWRLPRKPDCRGDRVNRHGKWLKRRSFLHCLCLFVPFFITAGLRLGMPICLNRWHHLDTPGWKAAVESPRGAWSAAGHPSSAHAEIREQPCLALGVAGQTGSGRTEIGEASLGKAAFSKWRMSNKSMHFHGSTLW